MEALEVTVRGRVYTAWTSVSISRSMEAVAGSFQVTAKAKPWFIPPGAPVRLRVEGADLIQGYVDSHESSSDRPGALVVSGRDKTADLIDCSAMNDPSEWRGLQLHEIAAEIADPFGIEVALETEPGPAFPVFRLQPGEKAWGAIERACRLRGVLAYTRGDGILLLTAAHDRDHASVPLFEGRNIESFRYLSSLADRFSAYVVRGQGFGSDEDFGDVVAGVQGDANDAGVTRYRPLAQIAEGAVTGASAQRRAQWEAAVRAARSAGLSVLVMGWRETPGGPLWRVNSLVQVEIPSIRVAGTFRIAATRMTFDERAGTRCDLSLARPDAFHAEPLLTEGENPFAALVAADQGTAP